MKKTVFVFLKDNVLIKRIVLKENNCLNRKEQCFISEAQPPPALCSELRRHLEAGTLLEPLRGVHHPIAVAVGAEVAMPAHPQRGIERLQARHPLPERHHLLPKPCAERAWRVVCRVWISVSLVCSFMFRGYPPPSVAYHSATQSRAGVFPIAHKGRGVLFNLKTKIRKAFNKNTFNVFTS